MVSPRHPELAEALATIQEQATLIARLQKDLSSARDELSSACGDLASAREELVGALERIAELEGRLGGGSGPKKLPHFIKANRPERPEGVRPRKKREENHARKLEPATEEVIHSLEQCPDCSRPLPAGWVHRHRQVIDIPAAPYIVRDHVVMGHRCGVCGKSFIAPLDLSGEVVGRHRVGIRVMALVAYLRTECRMPLRGIRKLLEALYELTLSVGELTKLLHEVAERGSAQYEALQAELRASPVVHADETGWREDGANGYVWVFATEKLRWFVRSGSRASAVPLGVLGADYSGVLVTDFYSGYSPFVCEKQRCWVHYLRDLRELAAEHAARPEVLAWIEAVRAVYEEAVAYHGTQPPADPRGELSMRVRGERIRKRKEFERKLRRLAQPALADPTDPRHAAAARIERFWSQFFVFVEHPEAPPDNNLAERALRPTVIARKGCGGTRSPCGSATMAILRTLLGTWLLRGLDPLEACRQLLASSHA